MKPVRPIVPFCQPFIHGRVNGGDTVSSVDQPTHKTEDRPHEQAVDCAARRRLCRIADRRRANHGSGASSRACRRAGQGRPAKAEAAKDAAKQDEAAAKKADKEAKKQAKKANKQAKKAKKEADKAAKKEAAAKNDKAMTPAPAAPAPAMAPAPAPAAPAKK